MEPGTSEAPRAARVLVVDDEVAITEVLALVLGRAGLEVAAVFGGWDALAKVQAEPPDVVLSDIRMHGGDGIELLEAIQQLPPPRPAVALMSSYADILLPDILARGAAAFVQKPIQMDEMVRAVTSALMPASKRWARPMDAAASATPVVNRRFPRVAPVPRGAGTSTPPSRRSGPAADFELVIGRGGIFLPAAADLPRPEQWLRFHFTFADGTPDLEGSAVCRWSRPESRHGLAAGAGLELASLTPPSLAWATAFIAAHDPQAHVPFDLLPAASSATRPQKT